MCYNNIEKDWCAELVKDLEWLKVFEELEKMNPNKVNEIEDLISNHPTFCKNQINETANDKLAHLGMMPSSEPSR